MDLLPTAEQQQIRDAISAFAARELPANRMHDPAMANARREREVWSQMAELGWMGLGLPDSLGGIGCGAAEDALLFRECGRHLVSPIVLAARLGAEVAARNGKTQLAQDIMTGARPVSVANVARSDVRLPLGAARLQVIDAAPGDLVLAWTEAGAGLFDLDALSPSKADSGIDETLGLTVAYLDGGSSLAWCKTADADLSSLATVLSAAMLTGMAEATCDMAIDYAKLREQFGRKIGSFQVIQHYCVDMTIAAEAAWAQSVFAVLTWQTRAQGYGQHVAAASLLASDAALQNARTCIQIHGGMGFSAECDAHLFLKRSHAISVLGQRPQAVLARLVGAPCAAYDVAAE